MWGKVTKTLMNSYHPEPKTSENNRAPFRGTHQPQRVLGTNTSQTRAIACYHG